MQEFRGSMFSVKELAFYMGVSAITVHRLLKRREIPGRRVGHQWRFVKSEIDEWLRLKKV